MALIALGTSGAPDTFTGTVNFDNADFAGDVSVGGFLNVGVPTELTISGGVIIATGSNHTVDTEADAATDNLDTINGGSTGDILILRAESSTRTVVVKDGVDNLRLNGDFSLTHANDKILLIESGGVWEEISRSDNSA